MSKQMLIDSMPLTFSLEEAEGTPGKLVARGQFACVDRPTENKRLYKRSLWEREINRTSESMKDKRVLGELDHPCLTSDAFRVLTNDGWKSFRDVRVGDEIWSRVDGIAVLSKVEGIVDEPYDGPVYAVKGRSIDSEFTPEHRFLLTKRPDNNDFSEVYVTVGEIAASRRDYNHSPIPKTATWQMDTSGVISIPGVHDAGRCCNDVEKPLELQPRMFAAFMGLYLSEGHTSSESSENYGIHISQKTGWSRKLIWDEVLSRFPSDLVWHEEKTGFYLSDARLYAYLQALGDAYTKYVPAEVKALDTECLKELVYWFCIGDGRVIDCHGRTEEQRKSGPFKAEAAITIRDERVPFVRRDLFSVSERLVRDLHECVVKAGGSGTLVRIDPGEDYTFAGRTIRADNKVPLHQLHISTTDSIWLDSRFVKIEERRHTGHIYCLSVTHGNFYMEQNGKAFWTGNSDGRTKLVRASHLMTGLRIDGDEVIGEAEIMDTPNGRILKAILQAGAKVGVSSRGFGTTKTIAGGIEEVQEDFRLDTFDFVADPATKTAYPKIFAEELEKIPEDEMELTLESLKKDYPGLVEALSKEAASTALTESTEKHGKSLNEAVAAAEDRTEKRLREKFSSELRRHIEQVEGVAREKAISEALSDPGVAGAKQILERIASIIMPFGIPMDQQKAISERDDHIAKLEASLAERELEVQAARAETAEFRKVAMEAAYRLHLERQVSEDVARDTIIKLVGDLSQYKSPEDITEKVEAIRSELTAAKEKQEEKVESVTAETSERLTDMEKRLQAAEDRAKVAEEREAQATKNAEKAIGIAESMQLQMYVESVVGEREDADVLRRLCEAAKSTDDVDSIVAEHTTKSRPKRRLDEDEAARIRARVNKGKERSLEEDTHGKGDRGNGAKVKEGNPLSEFGMTEDEFDTFAGTKGLRS